MLGRPRVQKRRVWATLFLIALLMLTTTPFASAQSDDLFIPLVGGGVAPEGNRIPSGAEMQKGLPTNIYIVVLRADPVVSYAGNIAGLAATAPTPGSKVDANSADVQSYVSYLQQSQDAVLAAIGASPESKLHSYTYALNGFAAKLTPEQVEAVSMQPEVALVLRDQFRFKQDDDVNAFLGLSDPETGARSQRLTGEDVVVGIIDSGIWPEHPSFADDGSYGPSPVPPVPCEFGNTAHNPNDLPFECNNKLLGARQVMATYEVATGLEPYEFDSARDDDGHGTHTASTAAGNAGVQASIFGIPRGRISGVAPRARIIAYKALGELGGYTSDLAAAIDYAVADGVDVINYSIGGGASLLFADDIAFLFAVDAGVFVATSAGNSGPGPATVGSPAVLPWLTAVGASFPNRAFISEIKLEGRGRVPRHLWGGSVTHGISDFNLVDAEGIADTKGDTSGQCLNPFPAGTFQPNDAVLCNNYDFGVARTTRVQNVKDGGGGAVLIYNVPTVNVTPTDNHPLPTVHMLHDVGIEIKQYLGRTNGPVKVSFTASKSRFAGDDRRVTPYRMTSFSSRGPNPVAEDIIKPDVTAPGYQILAGASPIHYGTAVQGELFQAIMGTSMSSPYVAGLFALIKQAHPDWSPAMARSALMTTAHQKVDNDWRFPAGPFDMGAGHVDATNRPQRGSMFEPGLVYDAGLLDYMGFLCGAYPDAFTDPEATCTGLENAGIPTDPSDLNLPSIGIAELPGSQTVIRTVTSVGPPDEVRQYKVRVNKPRGYDVTVVPDTLTLAGGESATFEVTITNRGRAPINEWRFGSLTWISKERGRDIEVYSPIAVRAALVDIPSEVSGSGDSGTVDIPVKFGYSGDYAVQAYGLVAATQTVDDVDQDEDGDFDPEGDTAAGTADLHIINVAGAAHLRIAIPPNATEENADLDVYVFDPDGNFVAASFNPGTNELIDIPMPMDGDWEVYVHGWAAPGGNSPYTMYSWVVPNAAGLLQITSAPTAATIGTVGIVTLSWSGAGSEWNLGVVTHSRDGTPIATTLVNINEP